MNYKIKSIFGWATIILISLIPVLLFFTLGSGLKGFGSFSSSVYSLGRICALMGVTLFALNFVLSTRLKFLEEIFGGMDKVYLVHGITGGIAFMLILAHPLLLAASLIPKHLVQAASYFIPGGILSLDLGLIAILGLISLIFITFFTKMKYNHWKYTHEFMGLVFAFAVLHILLVDDSVAIDSIFPGYSIFTLIIAAVGFGAIFYSWIVRKKILKYAPYKISSIKINKNIVELDLEPKGKQLKYNSGQFIFLRFYNENLSKEQHPFSISSKTDSKTIKVFVKESGDFTDKLINLKVGDEVSVEGPYGKFNFRNYPEKNQVWLAAGIGITPFIGMIEDLKGNEDYKADLYYIFRENYIITKKYAQEINDIKNLKFIPWNSQKKGRPTIKDILEKSLIKDKEILICGPLKFKEEMIKKLRELGIKKNRIHEEVFELK